jgi:hypothetical protein
MSVPAFGALDLARSSRESVRPLQLTSAAPVQRASSSGEPKAKETGNRRWRRCEKPPAQEGATALLLVA